MSKLRDAICRAINCASAENGSDTPDSILAEYLTDCLAAYDRAVVAREKFYGRDCGGLRDEPSGELDASKPAPPHYTATTSTPPFFVFDVESVGLHGEGFAVAGGIYINGSARSEFRFCCPLSLRSGRRRLRSRLGESQCPRDGGHAPRPARHQGSILGQVDGSQAAVSWNHNGR